MKGSGVKFYRFPSDPERKAKWIAAINRKDWYPMEYSWICSEHFVSGEKSNNQFAPNYVPRIFKHVKSPIKRRMQAKVADFQRRTATRKRRIEQAENSILAEEQRKKRLREEKETRERQEEEAIRKSEQAEKQRKLDEERKLKEQELQQKLEEEARKQEEEARKQEEEERQRRMKEEEERKRAEDAQVRQIDEDVKQKGLEQIEEMKTLKLTKQQLTASYNELLLKYNQMSEELKAIKSNEAKLTSKLDTLSSRIVSQQVLENDDKQVKFYTGLPSFAVLKAVFDLVNKGLPANYFTGCDIFDQFLMTLIKLRLNVTDQDLAYRFGVNQSTVSRCITKWLDLLYIKLSPLIHWPDRDQLVKTMPTCFRKNFKKCAIIIDCFEVFTERPTSLKARAQTWSNYKKYNTCKFLIGITPQGSISFISKGWGGRVSDVYLTENCGLMSKLLPGDVILADRGFTIEQAARMYCAEVKIPSFTSAKYPHSLVLTGELIQLAS